MCLLLLSWILDFVLRQGLFFLSNILSDQITMKTQISSTPFCTSFKIFAYVQGYCSFLSMNLSFLKGIPIPDKSTHDLKSIHLRQYMSHPGYHLTLCDMVQYDYELALFLIKGFSIPDYIIS